MPSRSLLLLLAAGLAALYWFAPGKRTPHVPTQAHNPGHAVYKQRLVAVGDLHGDIDNARTVLRMAHMIDHTDSWIGGTDILVQTGDMVDRGTYALDLYRLMSSLRGQAAAAGGRVVSILGNHEFMNAIGDYRYVTPADIKHWGGLNRRMQDLSIHGWLGQEWLGNYTVAALVPLSPYSSSPTYAFSHGSLRPSYEALTPFPTRINALGHSLLTKALTPPMHAPAPPNPYQGLPRDHTPEEGALYDGGGPLWWRGLAERDDDTVCGWAKELQRKIGARRIIGGHTPTFDRIVDRCGASIIIIDTGISSAYGGVLSALEIEYSLYPTSLPDDHRQEPLVMEYEQVNGVALQRGGRYREKEEVYALYEGRKKLLATEEREITL